MIGAGGWLMVVGGWLSVLNDRWSLVVGCWFFVILIYLTRSCSLSIPLLLSLFQSFALVGRWLLAPKGCCWLVVVDGSLLLVIGDPSPARSR